MAFTNEQLERYSRHIILKEVGAKGQKKLLNSSVLIIGAGGLGAPAALYLAAAGVGTIGIADADEVDLSNLQRQVIHATKDIGKPKVISAKESMEAINPDVTVKTYQTFVDSENIMDLIKDYDFIIDGTDNFPAKFLINDACVMAKKPFSHSGARGATTSFVENGQGDVLVAWENEAYLSMRDYPDEYEIVTPSVSILAQPTVAVVDEVVDYRDTREVATEYLNYLYSDEAQEIEAENYFRPTNEKILKEHSNVFDLSVDLVNISEYGGWDEVQKKHFGDGGIFDEIYER